MIRTTALVTIAALIFVAPFPASAARCPRACRTDLALRAKACRSECPKRKPGKACRTACASVLREATATCKHATSPTPPACGATTTTTLTTTTTIPTTTTIMVGATTTSTSSTTLPGGNTATLTIKNYLSWCTVSVSGGSATTTATQVLPFTRGSVVSLSGDKADPTFVFGYWVGTAGDTGPTHDTSMATTVTMDGDKTVQACCPFASDPNTPCPAP